MLGDAVGAVRRDLGLLRAVLAIAALAGLVACGTSAIPIAPGDAGISDADLIEDARPNERLDALTADGDLDPPDAAALADARPIADDASAPDATDPSRDAGTASGDLDRDGLDDALEARLAADYLPYLAVDPQDGCPRSAILYRVRPHPDAPFTRVHVTIVVLFERDCGASGHAGDDEVFGMTIDPTRPAPEGILAIRAIAHQSTPCEEATTCGAACGLDPCTTATRRGSAYPVVFYSRGKHGSYMSEAACDRSCFLTNYCTLSPTPTEPPMLNAGEPSAPLTHDLTASGLVTAAAGWSEPSLLDYDPWGPTDFGGAGRVSSDLDDPAFLTPACEP